MFIAMNERLRFDQTHTREAWRSEIFGAYLFLICPGMCFSLDPCRWDLGNLSYNRNTCFIHAVYFSSFEETE